MKPRANTGPREWTLMTATHMAAALSFEEGRFNDMRMPAISSQIATCLRRVREKTLETAA